MKEIVVRFKGGLGNQMFQYAFYKKLQSLNRNVFADLSWYDTNEVPFLLNDIFPAVVLNCDENGNRRKVYEKKHKNRSFMIKVMHKVFPLLRFKIQEKEDCVYQKKLLRYQRGILEGYWQTARYWETIAQEIIREFSFANINNEKLNELLEIVKANNAISVHIRRGDYLKLENQVLFGEICTLEYYEKAISYVRSKVENPKFIFFTNDAEWVKEQFNIKDAIFATDYINGEMPDWYDMYMMSQCKHHIVANSTFSWWGAYLGKNENKIVIAPSKWINGKATKDIWQKEWIRI